MKGRDWSHVRSEARFYLRAFYRGLKEGLLLLLILLALKALMPSPPPPTLIIGAPCQQPEIDQRNVRTF